MPLLFEVDFDFKRAGSLATSFWLTSTTWPLQIHFECLRCLWLSVGKVNDSYIMTCNWDTASWSLPNSNLLALWRLWRTGHQQKLWRSLWQIDRHRWGSGHHIAKTTWWCWWGSGNWKQNVTSFRPVTVVAFRSHGNGFRPFPPWNIWHRRLGCVEPKHRFTITITIHLSTWGPAATTVIIRFWVTKMLKLRWHHHVDCWCWCSPGWPWHLMLFRLFSIWRISVCVCELNL